MSFPATQWHKEVRALLPWWAAMVATILVCWVLRQPNKTVIEFLFSFGGPFRDQTVFVAVAVCTYAVGAIVLGAQSLGLEYTHHTLDGLLTRPVPRGQILRVKLAALGMMLVALGLVGFLAFGSDPLLRDRTAGVTDLMPGLVPLAFGLFIAPWLTMVGRGAMAGVVFTLVLPTLFWFTVWHWWLPMSFWGQSSLVVAAVGALLTRRTFFRLEVSGSGSQEVDFAKWLRAAPTQDTHRPRQSASWLMVKKELRLMQAALAVAALYAIVCAIGLISLRSSPKAVPDWFFVATSLNALLVPLLAGAGASADERRLGTADWHTLLPMAAWRQWAIKAGVVLSVVFVLAVALPLLISTSAGVPGLDGWIEPGTVMLLAIGALYASSLCSNALRALMLTLPVLAAGIYVSGTVVSFVFDLVEPAMQSIARMLPTVEIGRGTYGRFYLRIVSWMAVAFLGLVLAAASSNHRTPDRSPGRLVRQVGWLVGGLVAIGLLGAFVLHVHSAWSLASRVR